MTEPGRAPSLVVLQRVQSLTTDLAVLGIPGVVVLTDGLEHPVTRADAPPPPRVVRLPRSEWLPRLRSWAAEGPLDVLANDEFALSDLAELRAGLGLRRVTVTGLDGYLDKVVMKTRLGAAGVAVPPWVGVDRVDAELLAAGAPGGLRFPVVAKPRIGSNSRGVRVIHDLAQWRSWLGDRAGEHGWEVEGFVPGPMCFVDAVVVDGAYTPVLVGRYLGSLVPAPEVRVLGAVSVPRDDPLWERAAGLGRRVVGALGADGRFASHLELFDADEGPVVLEVSARASGALVSAMARVVSGHDLETAHLTVQLGRPAPEFAATGTQAAWISVLARPDERYLGPPRLGSGLRVHRFPAPEAATGRFIALMALLTNADHGQLVGDVEQCVAHPWFG